MTITAEIIADSVSSARKRITTMQLRYPRFIHSEFMTHRVFSRNASSSRAVPVKRLIEDVTSDPAVPIHWGKNQAGMQAWEELADLAKGDALCSWMKGLLYAIEIAEKLADLGAHKQLVNRVLEPYAHINVVVTATEWDNFFALRDHKDAEPHIQLLAQQMRAAMGGSTPTTQEIHLPYTDWEDEDKAIGNTWDLALVSAARCARVSYVTHDGVKPNWDADLKLAQRLVTDGHLSPFEHQAWSHLWDKLPSANFRGWIQFRQRLIQ